MSAGRCKWKVLALTCGPTVSCDALTRELKARQSRGLISEDTTLLVIDDPVQGIGSGGATLNALLVITEHLASLAGYTVVNSDVLDNVNILILHMGRHYMYSSTGGAFLNSPCAENPSVSADSGIMTVLDHLIDVMTDKLASGAPAGVWVCSTDMVLSIPDTFKIDWKSCTDSCDVIALSIHGDVISAQEHGVYVADEKGFVQDILYRSSSDVLLQHTHSDGTVNVVIGVVYFNKKATEKLLSFHTVSPLNNCTYVGIDSGAKPIQVSLFFDLLYAMCRKEASSVANKMKKQKVEYKWSLLHQILCDLRVKTVTVEDGQFHYLFNDSKSFYGALSSLVGRDVHNQVNLVNSTTTTRVAIPSKGYISNCRLSDHIKLCDDVLVSGVDSSIYQPGEVVSVGEGIVYQHLRVRLSEGNEPITVPTLFGLRDSFKAVGDSSTFCNASWKEFYDKVGCDEQDIWSADCSAEDRTLDRAQLFPVMTLGKEFSYVDSLQWMQPGASVTAAQVARWKRSWRLSLREIVEYTDLAEEFSWRRELFAELAQAKVKDTIEKKREFSLLTLYKTIGSEQPEHYNSILHTLDQVAMDTTSPGVAARALANVADVLGCMAGSQGGLRSGPSANAAWNHAYKLLEDGEFKEGVTQLAAVRTRWLSRGDHLIRAARHYEGAARILIRRAVLSAKEFIQLTPRGDMPAVDKWVRGACPARADIAGGWSDTPPISYEHGGAVTNAAILVDDMKPIGCNVRRIKEPKVFLQMSSQSQCTSVVISHLRELRDYCQPQVPGALLKASLVCADIIDLESEKSLQEQLTTRYGGGFEVQTWSKLPHGSGLGTSSILAGVVMAVLWRAVGQSYTRSCLVHAVLHVEQLMTTAGGWQDQVGGLLPGIKIGMSRDELPLNVIHRDIPLSPQLLQQFNDRFILIYTGKTRLARNLLQNVVRNWYARDPHIVQTQDDLLRTAYDCEKAFLSGDLERVGELWTQYWQLKKQMATGCEPVSVSHMIRVLTPHVLACCMAGAGGGGFLYVLTKEPNQRLLVEELLAKLALSEAYTIHKATVCTEGFTISVDE